MIAVRPVETDTDLETWAVVKSSVLPNEPVTVEQLRATDEDGRLLVLAERDGTVAGCGIAARSHFAGHGFVAPRVLAEHRNRGVGRALMAALADHVRALGRDRLITFVYADEPHSVAFAERYGLQETDYQLEQTRQIGAESPPTPPAGIELVSLEGRREELLRAVWPVALEGYEDMPLPGDVTYLLDEWLRDEASRPGGSFAAFEDDEPVGYAGLLEHANGDATAEHGLTVVRRDRRGRGIGRVLKRAQLHWAAESGLVELVTWTQKGNERMQALNRSLGYADHARVITYQGPLSAAPGE
jgi:GNAT superfamily N-acetyltransferase